jgi:hypothetical protein
LWVNTDTPLELTLSPSRGGETIVGARRRAAARRRSRSLLVMNNTLGTAQMVTEPEPFGSVYDRLNPQAVSCTTRLYSSAEAVYPRIHSIHPT